jgi:hypothetical protein
VLAGFRSGRSVHASGFGGACTGGYSFYVYMSDPSELEEAIREMGGSLNGRLSPKVCQVERSELEAVPRETRSAGCSTRRRPRALGGGPSVGPACSSGTGNVAEEGPTGRALCRPKSASGP